MLGYPAAQDIQRLEFRVRSRNPMTKHAHRLIGGHRIENRHQNLVFSTGDCDPLGQGRMAKGPASKIGADLESIFVQMISRVSAESELFGCVGSTDKGTCVATKGVLLTGRMML